MTRTEHTVRHRLVYWQTVLRLDHWRIDWLVGETPGGLNARVTASENYEAAELRLDPAWAIWEDRKLDEILVHELLHLILHDTHRIFDNDLEDVVHPDAISVLRRTADHTIERAVEHLAWAIVALDADSS